MIPDGTGNTGSNPDIIEVDDTVFVRGEVLGGCDFGKKDWTEGDKLG
jgi:hypothetical protein